MVEQFRPYSGGDGSVPMDRLPIDFGDRDWLWRDEDTLEVWGRLESGDQFFIFDPEGLDEDDIERDGKPKEQFYSTYAQLGRYIREHVQQAKFN
jgi:hypothetical protein